MNNTRKISFLGMLLLIGTLSLLMLTGCNDTNNTNKTPSGSAPQTSTSPTVSGNLPNNSPSVSQSPGGAASQSPDMSPEMTETLTPQSTDTDAKIPDFMPGTRVDESELPTIAAAVREKYPDATINSITHAMFSDKQVYEVILVDKEGATHTVYVSPDGGTVTDKQ